MDLLINIKHYTVVLGTFLMTYFFWFWYILSVVLSSLELNFLIFHHPPIRRIKRICKKEESQLIHRLRAEVEVLLDENKCVRQ